MEMSKWIKNLLGCRNKQFIKHSATPKITGGERDKNGFAYLYIDGKNTGFKALIFSAEEMEKLNKLKAEYIKNKENEI